MTSAPDRRAVIVGLFLIGAVAILAGGVLAVGNLNDLFSRTVTVSAVFDEVNGLKKGDNVWFSGLKVGTVAGLAFDHDSQVKVGLRIDAQAAPHIYADALAKIGSDGLIGNRIVVLYAGTSAAPPIAEGVVLGSRESVSTEHILATLQENNQNLLAITRDIKGITGELAAGEGTIGKLLTNDELYASANEAVATLKATAVRTRMLVGALATFSAKLNRKGVLLDDLLTDRTSYAALTGTVAQLRRIGDKAAKTVDALAARVADPATPLGVVLQDKALGADLKATLENVRHGSVLLNQDLEALKHSFPLRGYYRRQARVDARARRRAARGK